MRAAGREIISLGIGSPDMPPHPSVTDRLQKETLNPRVHGYQPYNGSPVLREAFASWYAKYYGVEVCPKTEVLPLIGSRGVDAYLYGLFE